MTDIFFDGRFVGTTQNPRKLVETIRRKRREGKIPNQVNVAYLEHLDIVDILSDPGRARRPLIVVENGKPKLTIAH